MTELQTIPQGDTILVGEFSDDANYLEPIDEVVVTGAWVRGEPVEVKR